MQSVSEQLTTVSNEKLMMVSSLCIIFDLFVLLVGDVVISMLDCHFIVPGLILATV